ncbi:LysR family transcriptional regulator [Synechococcus sp. HJ21-Hayes]|uniref:helix-turn-helix domain-containing protein n=1 Tax=unclassified Synechococcus TaxID=2626047 RepID=UPI0020CCBCA4|nr:MULTISPECIES: LysR family transcriptional regulator [unclassified Synechococcus]MCP9832710.1 LysR family transcriptional regulator [Synechococcus sp. JJ3a-Johnson]MCP9854104.1 LysR family transcriptional regulator [Synechococcus sp. HJ21-Hayes]
MSATADSRPYRIPSSLRDLVMLDLLELTGSTTATAEMLTMSQPSVSRRYRSVARDLGLARQSDAPLGRRFADAPWIPFLRRGINHHRLAGGVLRIGSGRELEAGFSGVPWAQWVRMGRQQQDQWRPLLTLELLDAIAVEEVPELSAEEAASLALVEVRSARNGAVVLICRRDPLVLEICSRVCGWMELP